MPKNIKHLLKTYESKEPPEELEETPQAEKTLNNSRKNSPPQITPLTKVKLDLKDKKILDLLKENSRFSNSQIAKKVQLSKPAVEYRIQRLQKNKAIFEYFTKIDFSKLGYSQYKMYFKFQNASLEDEKLIVDYWIKDKNSVWLGQTRGRWDLAVSILARSNFEFGKVLSSFLNKFSNFILEKDVLLTEYSPIYERSILDSTKTKEFVYGSPSESVELDETDKKILKTLATNARISIIDLVEKTSLSRDIINYRMKKLLAEKMIFGFSCYPNLHNIGLNLYKIIIRTKNFNENSEKQIRSYLEKNPKVSQFLKLVGSWDLEIEVETENEDELYQILNDIRKEFSSIIRDFDILRITETFKYNYYPF